MMISCLTIQRLTSDRRGWGGASLLPYTPAGMMGNDDDDQLLDHPEVGQ